MGRWVPAYRLGQAISCGYQYGAIGPDVAMTIGGDADVQRGIGPPAPYKGAPVCCVSSDAGIAYSLFELDTAQKYKMPIIAGIYNNNSWGMWPRAVGSAQFMHMYLFQENLRYDKMAEGLGARGEYVRTHQEFKDALARAPIPTRAGSLASTFINCQALKEFTSARDYPPGNFMNPEPGGEHSSTEHAGADRQRHPAGLRVAVCSAGSVRGASGNGKAAFQIVGHRDRRFDLSVDWRRGTLRCPVVLPQIPAGSALYRQFREFLKACQDGDRPDHRRIDGIKAKVACTNRSGNVALTMTIRYADYEYSTRKFIHLIQEIYLVLLAEHFEYQVAAFDLDPDRP